MIEERDMLKVVAFFSVNQIAARQNQFRLTVLVEIVDDHRAHSRVKFRVQLSRVHLEHLNKGRLTCVVGDRCVHDLNRVRDTQACVCFFVSPC